MTTEAISIVKFYTDDEVVIDSGEQRLFKRLECEAMVHRSTNRWRRCLRAPEFWRLGRKVCFVHMRSEEVAFLAE